ncbi:MAG: hypothetical protein ABR926_22695 [Streptosporangiaceae bacterium]|jgi:hypothetical protein
MTKDLSERVSASFGIEPMDDLTDRTKAVEGARDQSDLLGDVKDYTEKLLSTWKDVSASINREATLTLLLIAVFELLAYQSTVREFTIGPFSLGNATIVQIGLPFIVAYLVYDVLLLTQRLGDMEYAYDAISAKFASRIHVNALDSLIKPSLPTFWTPSNPLPSDISRRVDRLREITGGFFSLITFVLLPIAFEAQAFYHLYQKFGYHDPLLWISAVITSALLSCSVLLLIFDESSN